MENKNLYFIEKKMSETQMFGLPCNAVYSMYELQYCDQIHGDPLYTIRAIDTYNFHGNEAGQDFPVIIHGHIRNPNFHKNLIALYKERCKQLPATTKTQIIFNNLYERAELNNTIIKHTQNDISLLFDSSR